VPEPVEKWQNVMGKTKDGEPTSFNLLDEFYRAPERYAYTFQNYVFYTRFLQEQESRHEDTPLRLMERSVFSDRHVFVSSIRESNWMNDIEMTVYESWFDHVVENNKQLVPNGFIYLRAEPKTCHNRLHSRAREEESTVSMEYLSSLHEKHESWFKPDQLQAGELLTPKGVVVPANAASNGSTLSLNAELTMMERSYKEPPAIIRDRVVWMDNSVHSAINKVPALILDCDPSIDMDTDSEAKAMYGAQVRAFYDYVSELQDPVDRLAAPFTLSSPPPQMPQRT
jgi:thymidylate kinase